MQIVRKLKPTVKPATDSVRSQNETELINRKRVKMAALSYSASNRAGKFTRVGASFLSRINSQVKNLIQAEVQRHPSVGKTLK